MTARSPSRSALLAAAFVAFAGVLSASAGVSLSTGCGEGFVEDTAGAPPTFETSPTRVDGGYTYPAPPDAAIVCTAPSAAVVSGGSCVGKGGPPRILCNPLTNVGCLGDATCDFSVSAGIFRCFPHSEGAACDACSESSKGPFCGTGLTCRGGLGACTRYCCGDEDCGGGTCVAQPPSPVGICDAVGSDRLATFGVGEYGGGPRPNAVPLCDLPVGRVYMPGYCVSVDPAGEAKCNPVTNEGCAQGEACDVIPGGFRCLPIRLPPERPAAGAGGESGGAGAGGSSAGVGGSAASGGGGNAGAGNGGGGAGGAPKPIGELCGACDDSDLGGPTCQQGLHCVNGACARFCCWDDDCGKKGECDLTFFGSLGVGVCVGVAAGGAGGVGGVAGAGAGGAAGIAGKGGAAGIAGKGGVAGSSITGGSGGAAGLGGLGGKAGFGGNAGFGASAGSAGFGGFGGADGLAGVSGAGGAAGEGF